MTELSTFPRQKKIGLVLITRSVFIFLLKNDSHSQQKSQVSLMSYRRKTTQFQMVTTILRFVLTQIVSFRVWKPEGNH